ncbi:MAG: hypothetical protein KZQ95_12820 [Candidatus Thiodiazotropha sp. (ex Epidulcina cf. delphinae)]|nr:hypothetical protein [Candidatus Thiodiazotropha sp. (ex Epidulcina cf. delphinae)]
MAKVISVSLGVEKDIKTNLCYIIMIVKIEFTAREALVLADSALGPGYFTLNSSIFGQDPVNGSWVNTNIIDLDEIPITDSAREQTIRIEKTVGCELLNESSGENEVAEVDQIIAEVDLHNNDIDLSSKGQSAPFIGHFERR